MFRSLKRCTFSLVSALIFLGPMLYQTSPAYAQNPTSSLVERAKKAFDSGKHEEAIQFAEELIKKEPNNPQIYNIRGMAYQNLGQYSKAIDDFSLALKLKNNFVAALINRGNAYKIQKQYSPALADINSALDFEPDNTNALISRGSVFYLEGSDDAALSDFNRASQIDPKRPEVYLNRAQVYLRLEKYNLAILDLDRVLQHNPANDKAYSLRAKAHLKTGMNDLAIKDCDKALSLKPEQANPHFLRALAYRNKGDTDKSLADFHKALELKPDSEEYRRELTQAKETSSSKSHSTFSPDDSPPLATTTPTTSALPWITPQVSPPERRRILVPFKGFSEQDPCAQATTSEPGAPWAEGSGQENDPTESTDDLTYQRLLDKTMQNLNVLYGSMTPVERKNFYAFWAPFSDFPSKQAQDYFQAISPLLDETILTLSNLEGAASSFSSNLEDALLSVYNPGSVAGVLANLSFENIKNDRYRLQELLSRIESLGNPPNPLAAKCAARNRHRKALANKPPEEGFLEEIKKSSFLSLEVSSPSKHAQVLSRFPFIDQNTKTSLSWDDTSLEGKWETDYYHAPCDAAPTSWSNPDLPPPPLPPQSLTTVVGELSPEGRTLLQLSLKKLGASCSVSSRNISRETLKELELEQVPLYSVSTAPAWKKFSFQLLGPKAEKALKLISDKDEWVPDAANSSVVVRVDFIVGEQHYPKSRPQIAYLPQQTDPEDAMGSSTATKASFDGMSASLQSSNNPPKDKESSSENNVADDPKLKAEAIALFEARAEQFEQDAVRWEKDAQLEKDLQRRKELESRALERYAQAQAERDTAETIRGGIIVKTRTEWDEKQSQTLVKNIKQELALFDLERKIVGNINKVSDMIGGVEGVTIRKHTSERIGTAIKSPTRLLALATLYDELQNKVVEQGEQQIAAAEDKVALWESRIAIAENVQWAASMGVMFSALWAPAEIGSLALGYSGASGFAEGGVIGATKAVTRSISDPVDVILSAYEGAVRIDPKTKEAGGVWGAIESSLWCIGTNKVMSIVGQKIKQAKAQMALSRQAAGGKGVKAVARAKGEGRIKEYDFKTPEERYKAELDSAKTPQEKSNVNKKYAIHAEREKMHQEMETARQNAEEAIHHGEDPKTVKENYNKELNSINDKYKDKTRNQEHLDIMKELGFSAKEPTAEQKAQGVEPRDIVPTGSAPKTAASDMDFKPNGKTPHEAYQKGKAYADALTKRGHNVVEYGDRWVDNTSDITIWKPDFHADKPGSSSFEAEAIFGSLPHSDKFATQGGIEWTSSPTHSTGDKLGAVIANAGKAAGAGLGNSSAKDLHTIGKSAVKAAEAAGIAVDPDLAQQITALKDHKTPEQAGIYDLGADKATKDKQTKSFLSKVQTLMGQAYAAARAQSEDSFRELEQKAASAKDPHDAHAIRSRIASYKSGDNAALVTIAQVSPGLAKVMPPIIVPTSIGSGRGTAAKGEVNFGPGSFFSSSADSGEQVNFGGLARSLLERQKSLATSSPLSFNSETPIFSKLKKRCQTASQVVQQMLSNSRPGSSEARYLTSLQHALEAGEKNPAAAVRRIRELSGTELPTVLAQLGVAK